MKRIDILKKALENNRGHHKAAHEGNATMTKSGYLKACYRCYLIRTIELDESRIKDKESANDKTSKSQS